MTDGCLESKLIEPNKIKRLTMPPKWTIILAAAVALAAVVVHQFGLWERLVSGSAGSTLKAEANPVVTDPLVVQPSVDKGLEQEQENDEEVEDDESDEEKEEQEEGKPEAAEEDPSEEIIDLKGDESAKEKEETKIYVDADQTVGDDVAATKDTAAAGDIEFQNDGDKEDEGATATS